jgi:DNA-binding transcriptional MerR regulator
VKVSELSRAAGVSLATLKYYQREGLVPDGVRGAANQVDYSDVNVQRVRLIRALLETGGLSIAAARDVIAAVDARDAPIAETFRVAQHAMSSPRTTGAAPTASARDRVQKVADEKGWRVSDDNPGIDTAARAIDGLRAIDFDPSANYLTAYAAAADTVAAADLQALLEVDGEDRVAERMVVGSALGDPLFAGLRRLAQQNATHHASPSTESEHHNDYFTHPRRSRRQRSRGPRDGTGSPRPRRTHHLSRPPAVHAR